MTGTTIVRRAASALAVFSLAIGTAAAGTIVVGLNQTADPNASKVQHYTTGGAFLGTLTGPPTVIDPTDFGEDSFGNL